MAYNYAAYSLRDGHPQIGILDLDQSKITKLTYRSGATVSSLYEVIEAGDDAFVHSSDVLKLADITLLPPISGRDILAVGKNYIDHAKEFSQSGFDSSDKAEQPSHPVIFTKRATSIVAHGSEIYPHPGFTESVDYEGEIGVIIGKPGYQVSEAEAIDHVWGYTIINDMTARERQRDHKQFYIGKSPDTFCPMGPIAVPKEHLPSPLRLQTHVNGEKRQEADSSMLIFSVPHLIHIISLGATIQAGDVIATGTPVGVGFGFRPMKFLAPGDEVAVSVSGLGSLKNTIASPNSVNPAIAKYAKPRHVPLKNTQALDVPASGLTTVGDKQLFYRRTGAAENPAVVFIHGLGGTSDYFAPFSVGLEANNSLHWLDIEGHGLSPTSLGSVTSIGSYADDIASLLAQKQVAKVKVVAHSMGCLIAVKLALNHPDLVEKLVLMGPPPSPFGEAAAQAVHGRANSVREKGMLHVTDALAIASLSEKTKASNGLALAALRLSVQSQHPEGYAKACNALADAPALDFAKISCPTLIVTGKEDKVSPPAVCEAYAKLIKNSDLKVLEDVGHWHVFEDEQATKTLVTQFI